MMKLCVIDISNVGYGVFVGRGRNEKRKLIHRITHSPYWPVEGRVSWTRLPTVVCENVSHRVSGCPPIVHPGAWENIHAHDAQRCMRLCAGSSAVHMCVCVCVCVCAASGHSWSSGAKCASAQVQLLLSSVAVISELRGINCSLQLS